MALRQRIAKESKELEQLEKRMRREQQVYLQMQLHTQARSKRQDIETLKLKLEELGVCQIVFGLWQELYFHISSNAITRPRPILMSSWPCHRISAMAGDDIRYSVSSTAFLEAVSFLRYFKVLDIKFSSSTMMLNSRSISAFNCTAVIIISFL